jgi:flagellar biosynthetic protein FlhB
MAQEDQDKTEQPTPYRLDEARKRGEVAKSAELVGAALMIGFAVTLVVTGADIGHAFAEATTRSIQLAGARPLISGGLPAWMATTYAPVLQALTPLILTLLVAAIAGNVLQTGAIFSTHPVTPDFKRLNPAQAFKRVFALRTLWELFKLGLKLSLLALVCFLVVTHALPMIANAAMGLPAKLPKMLEAAFSYASVYVLLVLALIAVLDWLFVRRDFTRKLRMSRRELRDEHKRRDGDPEIKSKQKKLIRDLLRKARAVPKVGEADFVLTNPTHVAVALQYRPATMRAPIVLAKGAGFLAERIRTVAGRHGVPLLRSPELARALYRECDIDAPVPEALYGQLAPLYRKMMGRVRRGAAA